MIHAGIKEEVKALCTKCDKPMLKVFSSPPVTFKGSGWASKEK
jgi:predicted nucleic acid-binding Zn ribbon protein